MKLRRLLVIVMSIMVIIVWGEFVRAQLELKPANSNTRMIDLTKNKYFEHKVIHLEKFHGKKCLTLSEFQIKYFFVKKKIQLKIKNKN